MSLVDLAEDRYRARMIEDTTDSSRRRGLGFVVKLVILAVAALVVLAIAGDDELRESLVYWARSPDRPWR
jgi:hypothetical protein